MGKFINQEVIEKKNSEVDKDIKIKTLEDSLALVQGLLDEMLMGGGV